MREDIVSRAVLATSRAGQLSTRLRETRDYRATMPVASRRRWRLSDSSVDRAGGRRVRRRVSTVEVEAAGGAVAMRTGSRGRELRPGVSRSVSSRSAAGGGQLRVSYVSG